MDKEVKELMRTAKFNRGNLKGNSIISNIDGGTYAMQIVGIGNKAVKLSVFCSFEDIIKYKNHRRLENKIYNKIVDVYPSKKKSSIWRVTE